MECLDPVSRLPSLLKGSYVKHPWSLGQGHPGVVTQNLDPGEVLKLEGALSVEALVRQITELDTKHADSTDCDSDVLQAAESEARRSPLNDKHVKLFDKSMAHGKRRRYIERHVEIDSDESLSDEEEMTDAAFLELYRSHVKRKKLRKKIRANPDLLLPSEKVPSSSKKSSSRQVPDNRDHSLLVIDDKNRSKRHRSSGKSRRKAEKADKMSLDQINTRRRRHWQSIIRKEIGKAHKSRNCNIKEKMTNSKRIASHCMRAVRQKALLAQRNAKEVVSRAKRLTREMQVYWKRFDRVERQQKRQLEKEIEEQQKQDLQLLEAKRQQRKLNFLITQTELYAHFIANKIGAKGFGESEASILNRLDETPAKGRLAEIDDYNPENAKYQARSNASVALESQMERTKKYNIVKDLSQPESIEMKLLIEETNQALVPNDSNKKDHNQPNLFVGTLKNYQLKGMNWLINLYDQGINGILADEMGLGKTVQSIAMLAHIAEQYNIWGPFLVITPASTLHNWQQEVSKFLPAFKVVPYWGSPQERKILRHFWDQTNLHTRSASFHIVITSYQLVVTDFKYFNRIKWQYLVLDEAQAIKSSSSQRWKMLLEFKCRNRLLLSGTPIQNSMAELWSLLHFVMPTLFDSHEEFNDWFSKDIESSAENKSQIDEKQISRLHMILKPFMLRRIKKDVENELTDKVEVLLYCPLTTRQKLLYMGLKRKIKIEELLQGLGSQSQNSALSSSLMNLVMQFRKVCNHPELFERREARSPFAMDTGPHIIPKLIFREKIESSTNPINHLKNIRLSIFSPHHIHQSLKKESSSNEYLEVSSSPYSFLRFVDASPAELSEMTFSLLARWIHLAKEIKRLREYLLKEKYFGESPKSRFLGKRDLLICKPKMSFIENQELVFTRLTSDCVYKHSDVTISSVPETMKHRIIRSKPRSNDFKSSKPHPLTLAPEFPHVPKSSFLRSCQPCPVPKFLLATCPRVATPGRLPYSYDRTAAWRLLDHQRCTSQVGLDSILFGSPELAENFHSSKMSFTNQTSSGGMMNSAPPLGWSNIVVPDKETLVFDAGKLFVLDGLLQKLKAEGHRVLIYSQMTRMIDLLEEYMTHRKHSFIRLDGSSKIHERRDMVADFQERSDIFVFLLSTRAGGLGINLTAADTVIFYDSDWNPTVDQQAMDRAHRLGQTKQVTVYRLICKGTIEERILQRAKEKSAIQEMVIQGRSFMGKSNDLKPKEVVSLLLDDDELQNRYKEQTSMELDKDRKRKRVSDDTPQERSILEPPPFSPLQLTKKLKMVTEESKTSYEEESNSAFETEDFVSDQESSFTTIDIEGFSDNAMSREPTRPPSPLVDFLGEKLGPKRLHKRTGGKRGRPKGPPKPRDNPAHLNGACSYF